MIAPTPGFIALQAALAGEYSLERELARGGIGVCTSRATCNSIACRSSTEEDARFRA